MRIQYDNNNSSSICQQKAVIFTHFGGLKYTHLMETDLELYNKIKNKYKEILSRYIECNREKEVISIVYVYVDWGLRNAPLRKWAKGASVDIPGILLHEEDILLGLLKKAEREARDNLGMNSPTPIFHYIGISRLIALLNELVSIDRHLIDYLSGPKMTFTYDSPKFVEAVIRLARGSTAHLAWDPIIRIDEDIYPNANSIVELLNTYSDTAREAPFFFFSGTYHAPNSNTIDHMNDHAVRTHWFLEGYPNCANPGHFNDEGLEAVLSFLADLNELGAKQIVDSPRFYSQNMRKILNRRKAGLPERTSLQVISGAGLIMSFRAIELLPPFMNIGYLIVWIDDYLKRCLHEALSDFGVNDVECVRKAEFKQNRPIPDFTWTETYLERLLRGCIFDRLITRLNGEPTEYSHLIDEIVRYRITRGSIWLPKPKVNFESDMIQQAEERYNEVIECWSGEEFSNYLSCEWAKRYKKAANRNKICKQVVNDALAYIDLVFTWPIIVRAIKRLKFIGHDWLFDV